MNEHLPKWLRHHNGDLPNPTPAEVETDRQQQQAESDYFDRHGEWSPAASRELEALAVYYGSMDAPQERGINWRRLHALIPWLAFLLAALVWAMFLLIPTAFSLHYAGMFPAANNWLYVAMGLILCLACFVAAQVKHGAHAIAFSFAVLLLSYWF